jgi:3,4-dihydroxy 2-butanone 4-phosphate synthase / GTP cyclohydrolase II
MFDPIPEIIEEIKNGKAVIVTDDEHRENEGDLIFAAEKATPELVGFMVRHTSGIICVPMLQKDLDRLKLPLMTYENRESMRTAFTISVDAATGVSTGISANDRARTIQLLVDPKTQADDLVRPGHVFPLRYREGGILARAGHTEAAIDLAILAGLRPAGVLCEVVNEDGNMARLPDLIAFKEKHGLKLCSVESLIAYRSTREKLVIRQETVKMPTVFGDFQLYLYQSLTDNGTHIALVHGEVKPDKTTLVRVHREDMINDLFGSWDPENSCTLHSILKSLAAAEAGILIYLRQSGRGASIPSSSMGRHSTPHPVTQENHALREYGLGAQMLADLGTGKIELLTNNPKHLIGLDGFGLEIVDQIGYRI